jgi:hypothetical protein
VDPTGNCIDGVSTLFCLAVVGLAFGFIADWWVQVDENLDEGMGFWDAVYYENIDAAEWTGATIAGGISGALGATLLPFVAGETALLFASNEVLAIAASTTTAAGYGAAINVSAGRIGEMLRNILQGCDLFYIRDRSVYDSMAKWGALTGAIANVTSYGVAARENRELLRTSNEVYNAAWDGLQMSSRLYPPASHPWWRQVNQRIAVEISKRNEIIMSLYSNISAVLSMYINTDLWGGIWHISNDNNGDG